MYARGKIDYDEIDPSVAMDFKTHYFMIEDTDISRSGAREMIASKLQADFSTYLSRHDLDDDAQGGGQGGGGRPPNTGGRVL